MRTFIVTFLQLLATATALPGVQIIDGEDAQRGEFPYQIRMTTLSSWNWTLCTGALVEAEGRQFILTNGYCANFLWAHEFQGYKLFAGELHHGEVSDRVQVRIPNRVIFPDNWDFVSRSGNIAIVGYEEPFELTEDVQPISLPLQGQNTTGDVLFCGWGGVDRSGSGDPDILQKLVLSVISDQECAEQYRGNPDYSPVDSTICAQIPAGGNSHCYSDLGGPAKSLDGEYLAGLAAWPETCREDMAPQNLPEVFTEVAHYVDWIRLRAKDL